MVYSFFRVISLSGCSSSAPLAIRNSDTLMWEAAAQKRAHSQAGVPTPPAPKAGTATWLISTSQMATVLTRSTAWSRVCAVKTVERSMERRPFFALRPKAGGAGLSAPLLV